MSFNDRHATRLSSGKMDPRLISTPVVGRRSRWHPAPPAGYINGLSLYEFVGGDPVARHDPSGLEMSWKPGDRGEEFGNGFNVPDKKGGVLGAIHVYYDRDVTFKTNDPAKFRMMDHAVMLEFKTADATKTSCLKCQWHQFYKSYRKYKTGQAPAMPYTFGANGTSHYLDEWYVDSNVPAEDNPYKGYGTFGAENSSPEERTMFDEPGDDMADAIEESGTQFEAYLECNGTIYWVVKYARVSYLDPESGKWKSKYKDFDSKAANDMGKWSTEKEWLQGYLHDDGPNTKLSNPYAVKNPLRK